MASDEKNTPFSVRMDSDDKEKLMAMIKESGADSNKDFMKTLMSAYAMNKVKLEIPEAAESIKKVEELTQLINDYFVNISKHIKITKESMNLQFTKDIDVYKARLETLSDENTKLNYKMDTLNAAYNNACDDMEGLKKELESKDKLLDQLNESLKDKNELVEEYKQKNDTLTGIVEEYKGYKAENDTLKSQLRETQDELQLKKNQLDNKTDDNEKLNQMIIQVRKENKEEIVSLKEKNKQTIVELENKHKDEIETVKDKASIEKDKAILELNKTHQNELQDQQHKHNDEIEEYQNKIKDLLNEIENFKKVSSKEVRTKSANNK